LSAGGQRDATGSLVAGGIGASQAAICGVGAFSAAAVTGADL
jgi:hypothetical protein